MQVEPTNTVRQLRGTPEQMPPTYNRCFIPLTNEDQRTRTSDNGRTTCKEHAAYNVLRNGATKYLYFETGIKQTILPRIQLIRAWEEQMGVLERYRTTYAVWPRYNNYVQINIGSRWKPTRLSMSMFLLFLRGGANYNPEQGVVQWINNGVTGFEADTIHLQSPAVKENLLTMWERGSPYIVPNYPEPANMYNMYIVNWSTEYGNVAGWLDNIGGIPLTNITIAGRPITRAVERNGVITLR